MLFRNDRKDLETQIKELKIVVPGGQYLGIGKDRALFCCFSLCVFFFINFRNY